MPQLIESIQDGVATLTLNRPERMNAFSKEIMDGLIEGLPRLAGDSSVGAIVLTGAGRAFCAGGDVKRMAADEAAERSGSNCELACADGSLAHAARESETDDRDGQRRGGGRRSFDRARLRSAFRR